MTLAQPTTQPAETDLSDLRNQLAPITLNEREDILREISAHIRDSAEAGTPLNTILARLGSPAQLAAEYRDGQLISAASRSLSPILLLRATLRVATKGVTGIALFLSAFIGYIVGGCLVVGGLLKPFFPQHVGLFTTSGSWSQIGLVTNDTRHEIFGSWGIPLALVTGVIVLILTTVAIRAFLRIYQKVQRSL